jgi:hypothetical protein
MYFKRRDHHCKSDRSSRISAVHSPSNRLGLRRPSVLAKRPASTLRADEARKIEGTARFTRGPEQTSRRAHTAQGDLRRWNTRNWRKESISLSGTPQPLPRGKVFGKKLSSRGHPGRRRGASRNQRNWFAVIAGAMTWLRVSSSGGIADAANALVNAIGRRHGRGKRSTSNSFTTM